MNEVEGMDGAQFAALLLKAFESMVREVTAELARAGHPGLTVSNEFAMQAIDGGADNAADLARSLGVTRQAAAKTIATLEGLQYVARVSDSVDTRRKNLLLTDHGRDAIAVGAAAFEEIYRRWSEDVGPANASITGAALLLLSETRSAEHIPGTR